MVNHIIDPDIYTKTGSVTKSYFRDVYPAVDPTRADFCQAGKVTIVTGAGKGIGVGIAAAHAKTGLRGLVLVARSSSGIEKVKQAIMTEHSSMDVLTVAADISDEKAVEFLFTKVKQHFGTADTLINNAGVVSTPFDAIEKIAPSVWWNDFEVNTRGAFLVNAAFLRLTKETPSVRPTVVNVVSNVGFAPPHLSSYFSSKVAVMKFTEILQAENPELAAYTLNPGIVNTDITFEEFKPYAKDSPNLVGSVTTYLSAKRPDYLRGRHLVANWDIEELEARKEEIKGSNLLKLGLCI